MIPRRRARRGPAPAAAREQRQGGRPRPGQQHHARALRRPLPADPQRPRRRRSPPAATTSPRSSSAPTRRCARPTRCSRSSPSRTRRSPSLARDADAVLTPLARERDRIGRLHQQRDTSPPRRRPSAAPTSRPASRSCPQTLRELRSTMTELQQFSEAGDAGVPDLGAAAPALDPRDQGARARSPTRPTPALTSLGNAAEKSQAPLVAVRPADPADPQARRSRRRRRPEPLARCSQLVDKRGGFENLMKFLFNAAGGRSTASTAYGHFLRAFLLITNCVDYVTAPADRLHRQLPAADRDDHDEAQVDRRKRRSAATTRNGATSRSRAPTTERRRADAAGAALGRAAAAAAADDTREAARRPSSRRSRPSPAPQTTPEATQAPSRPTPASPTSA